MTKQRFIEVMALLNYTDEDVENDFNFAPHPPFFAAWIGSILLNIYHVFAIIVMLNLLIALMTNVFKRGKKLTS